MPAQYPTEIMLEGSKKQYVDEPRQSSPAGLIIRQKEPTNLEMPFDQVDSYLTPTGQGRNEGQEEGGQQQENRPAPNAVWSEHQLLASPLMSSHSAGDPVNDLSATAESDRSRARCQRDRFMRRPMVPW